MDIAIVKRIQATPYQFFAAITGGGQSFIGDFCQIEGASKNLIGAIVPYNQTVFDNFIGGKRPDTYVSSEGARRLAIAAYNEAIKAGVAPKMAIGIGASSALAKTDERKDRKHKIYIAVHSYTFTSVIEVALNQGRDRIVEDKLVAYLILEALANATLDTTPFLNINDGEVFNFRKENDANIGYLINGETDLISSQNLADKERLLVFCGSFNPIHDGHKVMINMAEKATGQKVFLEMTTKNADKGFLDFIEIENRIRLLDEYEFILTNLPTIKAKVEAIRKYAPKAEITLVVGNDTWDRIWDAKYGYEPDFLEKFFKNNKINFLLFKRDGYAAKDVLWGKDLVFKHPEIEAFVTPNISSTIIRKKLLTGE